MRPAGGHSAAANASDATGAAGTRRGLDADADFRPETAGACTRGCSNPRGHRPYLRSSRGTELLASHAELLRPAQQQCLQRFALTRIHFCVNQLDALQPGFAKVPAALATQSGLPGRRDLFGVRRFAELVDASL